MCSNETHQHSLGFSMLNRKLIKFNKLAQKKIKWLLEGDNSSLR